MNSDNFSNECPFERKVVPAKIVPRWSSIVSSSLTSCGHELIQILEMLNIALWVQIDFGIFQPFESNANQRKEFLRFRREDHRVVGQTRLAMEYFLWWFSNHRVTLPVSSRVLKRTRLTIERRTDDEQTFQIANLIVRDGQSWKNGNRSTSTTSTWFTFRVDLFLDFIFDNEFRNMRRRLSEHHPLHHLSNIFQTTSDIQGTDRDWRSIFTLLFNVMRFVKYNDAFAHIDFMDSSSLRSESTKNGMKMQTSIQRTLASSK